MIGVTAVMAIINGIRRDHQNTLRQASTPIVPFLDDEILRPFAIDTVIIQSGLVDIGHL
jgi:hypothetical protein